MLLKETRKKKEKSRFRYNLKQCLLLFHFLLSTVCILECDLFSRFCACPRSSSHTSESLNDHKLSNAINPIDKESERILASLEGSMCGNGSTFNK